MAGAYEILAADYDWMFDDDALANGRAINHPATARLLQRISRTSAVLDAACGTGVDAAVLARRGFTVWAADGSEAMVEAAAARFRRERLAIPLLHGAWADLPEATGERFDVVLCVGSTSPIWCSSLKTAAGLSHTNTRSRSVLSRSANCGHGLSSRD